jgi:two-component system LytT family response regulator
MTPEWSALIADDEPAARRGVRQLLAAFPEFVVSGECRNGAEVLASLDALRPHVVFLDVQMPGMNGFDVIRRRTPARMPAVIFLTAYDEFALRAFEAQALDYLVKPVSEHRFAATMKRLIRQLRMQASAALDPRIVVATGRGHAVVSLSEIDWIEAADNYARLWIGSRSYLIRESLGNLEARMRAHGFIRAHRRALFSLACVRALEWTKDGGLLLTLRSEITIPVSRRRRAAVAAAIRSQSKFRCALR